MLSLFSLRFDESGSFSAMTAVREARHTLGFWCFIFKPLTMLLYIYLGPMHDLVGFRCSICQPYHLPLLPSQHFTESSNSKRKKSYFKQTIFVYKIKKNSKKIKKEKNSKSPKKSYNKKIVEIFGFFEFFGFFGFF